MTSNNKGGALGYAGAGSSTAPGGGGIVGTMITMTRGTGATTCTQPLSAAVMDKRHRQVKKCGRRFIFATDPANHFVCNDNSSLKPLQYLMQRSLVLPALPGRGAASACRLPGVGRQWRAWAAEAGWGEAGR
ncbi:hypothetical protein [Paraburkholderia ultramafica]|uniref:hypothetical protein n=1 Tax=Paraburkholderia ultramafica TaxID=1544867 RepID=UPI0015837B9D|nr:hypothetical protein [Paraburkholderia ultramafica]